MFPRLAALRPYLADGRGADILQVLVSRISVESRGMEEFPDHCWPPVTRSTCIVMNFNISWYSIWNSQWLPHHSHTSHRRDHSEQHWDQPETCCVLSCCSWWPSSEPGPLKTRPILQWRHTHHLSGYHTHIWSDFIKMYLVILLLYMVSYFNLKLVEDDLPWWLTSSVEAGECHPPRSKKSPPSPFSSQHRWPILFCLSQTKVL